MNNYKLLILDFDGTLCATHDAIIFCIKRTFKQLNIRLLNHGFIDETIRAGLGMKKTIEMLYPDLTSQKIQHALSTYEAIYLAEGEDKSSVFPKTAETLEKLYALGLVLTIVSNKAVLAVNAALERFKLKQYITMVIGDTLTIKKTRPHGLYRLYQTKI